MKIRRIIYNLRVDNFEKCCSFAEDILELKIFKKEKNYCIYSFDNQSNYIAYYKAGSENTVTEGSLISIVVENVDIVFENINKKYKVFTKPEKVLKYNIYHFYLYDPDNNLFEIVEYL